MKRSRLLSMLAPIALAMVQGCGGDDDGSGGSPAPTPAPVARDEAARCAALAPAALPADATVSSAGYVAEPATIGGVAINVPFCRIQAVSRPTGDSDIRFEVWMPPAASWNGKFQAVGSGSSAGSIAYAAMLPALRDGYAAMAQNNGHFTDATRPNGAAEQTWALGHPEKIIDFAYRAQHVSTVASKAVVQSYYDKAADKSYFVGCSQGGHHALMEASRYPEDFDGIVAGAPAWEWANLMVAEMWNSMPALRDPSAITAPKMTLLNNAVVQACDAIDGVTDGLVDDPRRCTFDPGVLQCTGADQASCLTPVQVEAARSIYGGARRSNGQLIFPPYTRGSELGWTGLYTGATPGGSGWDFFRYSVFQDPTFDNRTFDFDRDTDRAFATRIAGEPLASVYNATANLSRFRARGGKLIMYHGWADHQITPLSSIDYWDRVVAAQGKANTDAFLRMFMLPGVAHCAGGNGPANIGGSTGAAPVASPQQDVVRALDRWVTQGVAPDAMIASRVVNGAVTRTRPLCPYPQVAKYRGSGSIDEAASFACANP